MVFMDENHGYKILDLLKTKFCLEYLFIKVVVVKA